MEKKPLYHFYPFTKILSLGANSCNLHCQFCQNYSCSLQDCQTMTITPEELVKKCINEAVQHVAFTYTEPFTWYEYIHDVAPLLRQHNISVVLVTNGYINPEPLALLLPFISAMNIDIKSYSDIFYQKYCQGHLQPVLDTVKFAVGGSGNRPIVEITLLLIESLNDDPQELQGLYRFIADIDPDIPLHISKYFPRYCSTLPQTSEANILACAKEASKILNYVYVGNFYSTQYHNTLCPQCGQTIIDRVASVVHLTDGHCPKCHAFVGSAFMPKENYEKLPQTPLAP